MNVQSILKKIEDDAGKFAEQAKDEAERKAAEMRDASSKKLADMRADIVKQAEVESDALAQRMSRMAELDMRKELLQQKRVVMDEAFEHALKALRTAPKERIRALMLSRISEAAKGGETLIICADNDSWFDAGFMNELKNELERNGRNADLTLSEDKREGLTGAVLSLGGTEIYCTLEGMLNEIRPELETDVARILFED